MTSEAFDMHVATMWLIGKLTPYLRSPRKNDAAVDRMAASIQEFGFKIPCSCTQQWRDSRWAPPAESGEEARHR